MSFLIYNLKKFLLTIFTVCNWLYVIWRFSLLGPLPDLSTTLPIGVSMDSEWCFPPPPLTLRVLSLSSSTASSIQDWGRRGVKTRVLTWAWLLRSSLRTQFYLVTISSAFTGSGFNRSEARTSVKNSLVTMDLICLNFVSFRTMDEVFQISKLK